MDGSMSIVYAIRWRLVYLDDRQIDELPAGSPILDRRPDPVELHLIDLTGKAVIGIPIPPGCKPIFYRQRSIDLRPGNGHAEPQTDARLDATVFGYGRDAGSKADGKLYLWRNGQAVNCPPEHIAQRAIEMQLA